MTDDVALRAIYPLVEFDEAVGNDWLVTTLDNAIDSLEMIDYFLSMSSSPWRWKWVVIATHQTLYTLAIDAISGTAPTLTVMERNKAWEVQVDHRIYDEPVADIAKRRNLTEKRVNRLLRKPLRLISIRKVLYCMTRQDCLHGSNANPWKPTLAQLRSIRRLTWEFRNEFEHFQPKSWFVREEVFGEMLPPVLEVIRFIALESNCIQYYQEDREGRVVAALTRIETKLAAL